MDYYKREILKMAMQSATFTKVKVVNALGWLYLEKDLEKILGRMVKSGLLKRVKPGMFCLGGGKRIMRRKKKNQDGPK